MNISEVFIRRPIATALLMAAIVILGLIGYESLPVASLPDVDSPTIQVMAQLPGADPSTVASSVATVLERQFGEIPGLTQMTSSSALGYTQITLQFSRSRTVDSAAQDVQAAINAAQGQLPTNLLNPPIYRKTNPADTPILLIAMTSDTLPLSKVSDYADSIIAQKLSQVSGVGLVTIGGEQDPAIRVQLDPARLSAEGLDLETVRTSLLNATVNLPKGILYGGQQARALQTNDQLKTAQGFDNFIIAFRNGAPVRVRDVGRAIVAPEDKTLAGWVNTQRAILLAVQREPGANVIETVDRIKQELPKLEESLPPAVKLSIVSDRTLTIRASVSDVQFTLLLTIGLVVAVIFIFLRQLWATVIPAISVPLALIGTFAVIYVLGFSLDNLSLMALSIAIGFVVDDAIVMIENIVRHIEGGAPPMQAAIGGAGEIGFTVISISISLIAVFIPLFLMSGIVGLLLREFAVTVSVAILLSVVVSLSLTPMMCARLLKSQSESHPGYLSRKLEQGFGALSHGYDRMLTVVLRHRRMALESLLAVMAGTVALFIIIPKGFFPQQDTGMILAITEGAEDISPQGMMDRQRAILNVVTRDPAVAAAMAYIGPGGSTVTENDGRMFITLKPESERPGVDRVIARLSQALKGLRGASVYMQAAQDINVGSRLAKTQYQYTLVDVDIDELNRWAPRVEQAMGRLPQLTDVASDQQSAGRMLNVHVDRDVASRFGIDPATIDNLLYDAFGQRHIARIYTSLNSYYVILEVDPRFQLGPDALNRIYATAPSGAQVPLGLMATVTPAVGPLAVNHQDQFPSVTLSFNLAPGHSIGGAVAAIKRATAALHLPRSIAASFQGSAEAFQQSLSSTPILILAALVAVYIILGVLYESLIHPITIISTLPSAGFGALLTLLLFGFNLDVIGIIGIMLLIGIVKKNGIMLVDFALAGQRERGLSPEQAVYEACLARFRPILMTTMCALLAGVPLMLGTGTGSEIRQPLGYTIVGGLLVSQVLTLFTTPVIYLYMDMAGDWFARRSRAFKAPLPAALTRARP